MLDEETRRLVNEAIGRAVSSGQDIAEYLNRYGWIVTPSRRAAIAAEAVHSAADNLEASHNHGRNLTTPELVHQLRRLAAKKRK